MENNKRVQEQDNLKEVTRGARANEEIEGTLGNSKTSWEVARFSIVHGRKAFVELT